VGLSKVYAADCALADGFNGFVDIDQGGERRLRAARLVALARQYFKRFDQMAADPSQV